MAKFSLRRYDTQARLSVILSLASVVTLIGQVFAIWRERSPDPKETMTFYYGPYAKIAIWSVTAITLMLAIAGFGMGLSSAGQRRNNRQKLSWIGFFVGAGVLVLTLIVFAVFRLRGEAQIKTS